jgi:hypothetical protein
MKIMISNECIGQSGSDEEVKIMMVKTVSTTAAGVLMGLLRVAV